jgi:hypothetical protein
MGWDMWRKKSWSIKNLQLVYCAVVSLQLLFNTLGTLENFLKISLHVDGLFAEQVLVTGFKEVFVQPTLLINSSNDRSGDLQTEM